MRLDDLDLRELLQFQPKGGVLRFAGERAILLDAVAMGLLRKELIDTIGVTVARGVLTRFGFVHGWRTAEAMRTAFPWEDEREWRIAGGRLHMLQGLVEFEAIEGSAELAEANWRSSYEAEQHVLHLGVSDGPVCWTLTGFASGWLSFANGKEILCFEDKCVGKGDALCHFVGRTREAWGAEAADLPYFSRECLEATAGKLCETLKRTEQALRRGRRDLLRTTGGEPVSDEPAGMIARSAPMRKVVDLARRVAKVDTTVLVTGESGAGKERVARLLHDESPRASAPFLAVNCGAVTTSLLESELFGHAKGSFTGATHDRIGLFEGAAGGTLFLDEIGEIAPEVQVKLLRALQEREVRRVGETKNRKVDVRVIAATNRNLSADVAAGRFREDLYYRLRVIELHVPPLRERKEDVLPLARAMLARTAKRLGRDGLVRFTPHAAERLLAYGWPGNVRELENAVERAVVLVDEDASAVDVDELPEEIAHTAPLPIARPGVALPLEEVERQYVLSVLAQNEGNRARTAEQLGIGPATLYRKLKAWSAERSSS